MSLSLQGDERVVFSRLGNVNVENIVRLCKSEIVVKDSCGIVAGMLNANR